MRGTPWGVGFLLRSIRREPSQIEAVCEDLRQLFASTGALFVLSLPFELSSLVHGPGSAPNKTWLYYYGRRGQVLRS